MKRFMRKNLFYILFWIYGGIIFCELPGDDKMLYFHRKKFSLLFILSLPNKVNIK
jgi:uncharacterized membrane protein